MKSRIRRLQRDRTRRQMMKDVPTATAVVVTAGYDRGYGDGGCRTPYIPYGWTWHRPTRC